MTDYYPLLARAVAGLEKNTGDARRALYERARTALVAQLRNATPAMGESDVTRERLALEEAVRKVEAEAARQTRVERRPDPVRKLRSQELPRWEDPSAGDDRPSPLRRPDLQLGTAAEEPHPSLRRAASPTPSFESRRSRLSYPTNGAGPPDDEPFAADSNSPADTLEQALAPSRHYLRNRPSERRSLESNVNDFRDVVSEDLSEAPSLPRNARSRDVDRQIDRPRDVDRQLDRPRDVDRQRDLDRQRDFDRPPLPRATPRALDRHADDEIIEEAPPPDMLEPALGMDEPRVLSHRPRQYDGEEDEETPRVSLRSYRDVIRLGLALLLVAMIGGVVAWQWPNIAAIYSSLRAPATSEVAGTTSPAPASTRTKITDRFEPAGANQQTAALPPPGAAVAQRVVLYEEDASDPQGKRFVGSAIWRTERISPSPGQPSELAIRADVEIPDRRLTMTWSLRRNADPNLPASHTVEIMFKLPSDFSSGGVSNVPGILMKQAEQARGVPLAGLAVKVTNGFFLIGLSSVDADKERNIALLKERSWFDIPVVYNDNRRAILALEKGTPGERVFAEAFAAWRQ
jgi:hypothetical protein